MAEPRSFLQRWLRAMALTTVLGAAAVGGVYWYFSPRSDIDGLSSLIPASASSGIFVRGLDQWMAPAVELFAGPRGTPESRQALAQLRADTSREAGFDVTDPKGWRQAGFEIGGAWGAVSLGDDPAHVQIFGFLPLKDAAAGQATLERWLAGEGATLAAQSERGHPLTVITWKDGARVGGRPEAFTQLGGYLVLCDASASALDAPSSLRALLAAQGQPSLRDAPSFKAVRASLGDRWAALLYSSPAVMQSVTKQAHLDASPLLKGLAARGAGASLEVSNAEVSLRLRALDDPGFGPVPGLGQVQPNGLLTLGGDALAVARVSLNLAALDDLMDRDPRSKADRDRFRAWLKEQYGIDLSTEILRNLDGQFAGALLTPLQPGGATPDGIATVGVKDVNLAGDTLDRVAQHLHSALLPFAWTSTGVGERWTQVFDVAGGLAHGHLYIVEGPGREKQVHDGPVAGTIPMIHALPETARQAFTSGPSVFAYGDVARLLPLVGSSGPDTAAGQARRALQGLQAASFSLESRDSVLGADLTLYAGSGGWGLADAGAP